jgi:hypothetical protein
MRKKARKRENFIRATEKEHLYHIRAIGPPRWADVHFFSRIGFKDIFGTVEGITLAGDLIAQIRLSI